MNPDDTDDLLSADDDFHKLVDRWALKHRHMDSFDLTITAVFRTLHFSTHVVGWEETVRSVDKAMEILSKQNGNGESETPGVD